MLRTESKTVSGRFLLRLPVELHARLQGEAQDAGVSLNEYCSRRLSVPGASLLIDDGARSTLAKALAQFSEKLVGVLVFGSFARGDATATSDVDLLVVVERSIPIERALYRAWDAEPLKWADRCVDPHFVHLSPDVRTTPGAWCEAALDGVVLFERDGAVTRHLAAVRGDIATGRLVRRSVHGQPYWTVAA